MKRKERGERKMLDEALKVALLELDVNLDEAMERFIGDEELYLTCLKKYLKDDAFGKLGESIGKKDYEKAFQYAHSLKGVSGNLGLKNIYGLICSMVENLRAGKYFCIEKQYEEIMNCLERIRKVAGEQE